MRTWRVIVVVIVAVAVAVILATAFSRPKAASPPGGGPGISVGRWQMLPLPSRGGWPYVEAGAGCCCSS
jgi:hypothetical protein